MGETYQPGIGRRLVRFSAPAVIGLLVWRVFFHLYSTELPLGEDCVLLPGHGTATNETCWARIGPWTGGSALAVMTTNASGAPEFELRADGAKNGRMWFNVSGWPGGADGFEVRVRCATEGIIRGEWEFQGGRVLFAFRDEAKRTHWDWPHEACRIEGTHGPRLYRRFFPIPAFARSADVVLENLGRGGWLRVSELEVRPVRANPANRFWHPFWGTGWAVFVLAYAWRLQLHRRRHGWMVLAAAALIVVGMLIPERWIENVRQSGAAVAEWVSRPAVPPRSAVAVKPPVAASVAKAAAPSPAARPIIAPPPPAPVPDPRELRRVQLADRFKIHKIGHVLFFALLGMTVALAYLPPRAGRAAWAGVAVGVVLYAFAAEYLQCLSATRSARLADVVLNLAGVAVGVVLMERVLRRALRRVV